MSNRDLRDDGDPGQLFRSIFWMTAAIAVATIGAILAAVLI